MRASMILVLATTLVVGGCSDSADCSLEVVLEEKQPIAATDCGTIALDDSDTSFEAARSCIANAIDSEASFRVIWDQQGIDSQPRAAYVGSFEAGVLSVTRYAYDSDPSGGSGAGATASGQDCTSFDAVDPCDTLRLDLCFSCALGAQSFSCSE